MITWVATFLGPQGLPVLYCTVLYCTGPQGLPVAHKLDHVGHFSWVIMPVSSQHRHGGVQCPAIGDSINDFSQHIPCVKTTLVVKLLNATLNGQRWVSLDHFPKCQTCLSVHYTYVHGECAEAMRVEIQMKCLVYDLGLKGWGSEWDWAGCRLGVATNVEIIPTWPELMKIFDSVMNFLDFLPTSALCGVSGGWV